MTTTLPSPDVAAVMLRMTAEDKAAAWQYHQNLVNNFNNGLTIHSLGRLVQHGFLLHRGCGRYQELDLFFDYIEYCETVQNESESE